ncbi:MAG TPA: PA domain-containing protein [Pyrinomonadaceae bacterium]|nr:PA domain-containing protein [Pyrinomonadaceae bacterium]
MKTFKTPFALLALFVLLVAGAERAHAGATIFIINADGPNEGFNDPTPAAPVGGNNGTTLGQQRQIAFQHAANIWGQTIDSPEPIFIVAAFNPLGPGVLGSAGAWDVFSDFTPSGLFPGPIFPQTWHSSALADKRAGRDLDATAPDINAQFSSNFNFYLGLDGNHGPLNDLVTVLLHEFGHGLGFQNFVNESTGANLGNFTDGGRFYPLQTDVFSHFTLDTTNGLHWSDMTQAQRQQSAVRYGRVVWDGANVTNAAPSVLVLGSPEARVLSPASIAGAYQFGPANFGTQLASLPSPVVGSVVAAVDAAEPPAPPLAAGTTTDGCSPFANAAAVAGKIALIERGLCGFTQKVFNAQQAGAIGAIIYNQAANAAAGPSTMATDPVFGPQITIPSVSITRPDGLTILGQLGGGVSVSLGKDNSIRAGADQLGRVRLYMPFPVSGGSSGSHYDTVASRNLLMEPFISADLTHNLKAPDDLTLELMRDVGWFADADNDGAADAADCDPNSDLSPTVSIAGCDSGSPNFLFTDGCTLADKIQQLGEAAGNHGQFVSSVSHLTNALKKAGLITGAQKSAIQSCAAGASIP